MGRPRQIKVGSYKKTQVFLTRLPNPNLTITLLPLQTNNRVRSFVHHANTRHHPYCILISPSPEPHHPITITPDPPERGYLSVMQMLLIIPTLS